LFTEILKSTENKEGEGRSVQFQLPGNSLDSFIHSRLLANINMLHSNLTEVHFHTIMCTYI